MHVVGRGRFRKAQRRLSKHVHAFSEVSQLPDRWHRKKLLTCHWLQEQTLMTCAIDLAIAWGTARTHFKAILNLPND